IGEKFATYCLSDHSDKHSPLTNYNQQKRERRFLLVLKDQVSAPSIDEYFKHFNYARPHQALLYATPNEIYHGMTPKYSKGEYKGFEVKKAKK
ncbi:MAG: hypothetical protein NTY13_00795, partial [Chlamydiae bacterium]|nr:hypothetical protein [Chlamydiota bacterium]